MANCSVKKMGFFYCAEQLKNERGVHERVKYKSWLSFSVREARNASGKNENGVWGRGTSKQVKR